MTTAPMLSQRAHRASPADTPESSVNSQREAANMLTVIQPSVPPWTCASSTFLSKSTTSIPLRMPITTVKMKTVNATWRSRAISHRNAGAGPGPCIVRLLRVQLRIRGVRWRWEYTAARKRGRARAACPQSG